MELTHGSSGMCLHQTWLLSKMCIWRNLEEMLPIQAVRTQFTRNRRQEWNPGGLHCQTNILVSEITISLIPKILSQRVPFQMLGISESIRTWRRLLIYIHNAANHLFNFDFSSNQPTGNWKIDIAWDTG